MKRCLLLWVLLESMPAGAPAAVVPDAKAATNYYVLSSAAAQTNLVKLRRMANPVTYKQLGFSATNEPAAASNGVPLLVYEATLARLREYKNEPDYANLVEPTVRIIYPVLIGGEARCSHTLRLMADGSWQGELWGEPQLIKRLVAARAVIAPVSTNWLEAPFAVDVPVAGIWLVGYREPTGRLRLISTTDLKLGKETMKKNTEISPAVMTEISKLAQRYKIGSN